MRNPSQEYTILNVDDHDAGRYAKSRILQLAGYRVVEAATGADALRLIREANPQLILLDVKLPDVEWHPTVPHDQKRYGERPGYGPANFGGAHYPG